VPDTEQQPRPNSISRSRLVFRVLLFQLKLVADGLRDVLLFPVAVVTVVLGLLFGGKDPERYFRELMRFGRRTDRFINLFNQHTGLPEEEDQEIPTSDELLAPYQDKFVDHASRNPLVQKVDKHLDDI